MRFAIVVAVLLLAACETLTAQDQAYLACDAFDSYVGQLSAVKSTLPSEAVEAVDIAVSVVEPVCKAVFAGTTDYTDALRGIRSQILITQNLVGRYAS